jgi:hypothetical protein
MLLASPTTTKKKYPFMPSDMWLGAGNLSGASLFQPPATHKGAILIGMN